MTADVHIYAYISKNVFTNLRQYAYQESVRQSDIIRVALDHLFIRWQDDPATITSDLAAATSDPANVPVSREPMRDEVKHWRGRRLVACQAADQLRSVVTHLDQDDGRYPRTAVPPIVAPNQQNELINLINVTLRMILVANDGEISQVRLQTF